MGEKYEVPLKNENGDVIGTARIDPDEFPGGVVEVHVTDEKISEALRMPTYLSVYVPPETRMSGALIKPAEALIINKENKE